MLSNLESLSIREVSRLYGVTSRTLRFYESRGLINSIRDCSDRYSNRYYDAAMQSRLQLILKGKQLGFTLIEIKDMIDDKAPSARPDVLMLGKEQILAQIELLLRQRAVIEDAITELRAAHEKISHHDATAVTGIQLQNAAVHRSQIEGCGRCLSGVDIGRMAAAVTPATEF